MNLYNMLNGVSPATFFILPMLGKHPDQYPRFRDCFTFDKEYPMYDKHIIVYTRTGGGNRESYKEEHAKIRNMANYVIDYDDTFDSTYANWVFTVPEEWQDDYHTFSKDREISLDFSDKYKQRVIEVYPKIADKLDVLFSR